MAQVVVVVHSIVGLLNEGLNSAWLGSLLATLPFVVFFAFVILGKLARTSENLPLIIICSATGTILAWYLPSQSYLPLMYAAVFGLIGCLLYVFWFSRYGGRDSSVLKVGGKLPDFTLFRSDGSAVSSNEISQSPALLMFFRGNWCPLCMAQIKEIADQYQTLDKRGVKIYLISPQSSENTQELASRFSVPMTFLVDTDLKSARLLKIAIDDAVPMGVFGYDVDSVMPTVIMLNNEGEIIFADLTDNYRVRPEPSTFIKIFDEYSSVH